MIERTLIILKPEIIRKKLDKEIIRIFEEKGLKVIAKKKEVLARKVLENHYQHHKDKPFFEGLIKYMSSGPAIPMVLEGDDAVNVVRVLCGATNPKEAKPGTIRAEYGANIQENAIHASEGQKHAKQEIKRFFTREEIGS